MSHTVYSVTGFEIVGPYTLKIDFDDGDSQTIDFDLFFRVNCTVRFAICLSSTKSASTPRSTHWFGQMALTLIRRRFMIGNRWLLNFQRWLGAGQEPPIRRHADAWSIQHPPPIPFEGISPDRAGQQEVFSRFLLSCVCFQLPWATPNNA